MNPELQHTPIQENEFNDTAWEDLAKRADKAADIAAHLEDKLSNYSRIINGLASRATPSYIKSFKGDAEYYHEATDALNALDDYLKLIEDNPEFAKLEQASPTGAFPELEHVEDVEKVRELIKKMSGDLQEV